MSPSIITIHLVMAILAPWILLSGCTTSLVVSPSVHNLGPLNAGNATISASGAFLPETLPNEAGKNVSAGFEARAGYQFSESVRIEAKYFGAFVPTNSGTYANGFGALATIKVARAESLTWLIVAQGQFIMNDSSIEGFGIAPEFGLRYDMDADLSVHALVGPVYGATDVRVFNNNYYLGGIVNAGISYKFVDQLYVGFDLAGLYGYNEFLDGSRGAVSPSIQLTYTIPTR